MHPHRIKRKAATARCERCGEAFPLYMMEIIDDSGHWICQDCLREIHPEYEEEFESVY